jgi:hypothetical protein
MGSSSYYWTHFLGFTLKLSGTEAFDIGSYLEGLFSTDKKTRERLMLEAGYIEPTNARVHHALHDAVEQGETLAWALNFSLTNPCGLDSIM